MNRTARLLLVLVLALIAGYLAGRSRGARKPATNNAVLYYVDPMHPAYRSDKPGIAPDCGMDLVPVYAKDAARAVLPQVPESEGVSIDPATEQLYGIQVAKAQSSSGQMTVRFFGRVAADETRIYHVNISTAGFVKETHGDAVGDRVSKDQRLAVVYSSEVLYAAAGYLSGNQRIAAGAMRDASPGTQAKTSVSAQADYLRNLGMSDTQITEITTTHKIPENVDIVSPADGFILSRTISPGQRFEKNTEFYSIADLSRVWVFPDVFGEDARAFRPGASVRVSVPSTGETFSARVSNALPQIDSESGAIRPRLEVENRNFRLVPNTFVTVEVPMPLSSGITIPVDALLDSGLSKRVFVETSTGHFQAREVKVGWRRDGRVQIVSGLHDGERVASSGTFLIDSESRLRASPNTGVAGNSFTQARVEHDAE